MSNPAVTIAAIMKGRDLGEFAKCPRCKEYDHMGIHNCKPSYEAIRFEYHDEDDPETVFADGLEEAALTFAEISFSNWEYPREMEIWVRKDPDDEWAKFEVSVESFPSFSATPIQ